jgi:hypothetical protein
MIGEESELARRMVFQRIRIVGRNRQKVVVARVDTHSVRFLLSEPRLGDTVTLDSDYIEADANPVSEPVLVERREVPIDAAPDLISFGMNADVLGDVDASVNVNVKDAVVGFDALLRAQWNCKEQRRDNTRE